MAARPAVYVVSLGCPKNLVDTEVMCGGLAVAGFGITTVAEEAGITLVNTCSFIADARAEAEGEIHTALAWKKRRRGRRVVVSGCLPQRDLAEARRQYPGVDLFLGVDDVPRAAEQILQLWRGEAAAEAGGDLASPTYLYDDRTPRLLVTPGHYAYVKIADGCDHFCRFCRIPHIRGRQRSRSVDSVVAECRNLLDMGVRELNLIAQDTTRYGADRQDGASLGDLLRRCDALDGRFWVRLLYTHPKHVTPDLLDTLAGARHVVRYLDMPLQHIRDHVLKDMGRAFGEADTRRRLAEIRERVPGVAVRTTFLVGYPGETDADFGALCELVSEYRFERLGVFAFSPEPGTPAAALTDGLVPAAVAAARRDRLLEIQQGISQARNQALVGQELEVLLEGAAGRGRLRARSWADAPDIDNLVHVRAPRSCLDASFLRVRVTAASAYDLEAVVG